MIDVATTTYYALLTSALYFLGSLGIFLTYKIFNFANFSQADLMTLAAYISAILVVDYKVNWVEAVVLSVLATALVSLASYAGVYRPLINRKAKTLYLMTASFAMLFIYRYTTYILVYGIDKSLLQAVVLTPALLGTFMGMPVTDLLIYMLILTFGTFAVLWLVLHKTRLGIEMRAISSNKELALAVGIRVGLVEAAAWAVVGIAAALASVEYLYLGVNVEIGAYEIIPLFAVAILSGLEDVRKLLASAFIVGFVQKFIMAYLIAYFNVSQYYELMIPLVFIIVVLVLFPKGLEGVRKFW
jgi:branched-subunit amino acid ABC-type transport system permease component